MFHRVSMAHALGKEYCADPASMQSNSSIVDPVQWSITRLYGNERLYLARVLAATLLTGFGANCMREKSKIEHSRQRSPALMAIVGHRLQTEREAWTLCRLLPPQRHHLRKACLLYKCRSSDMSITYGVVDAETVKSVACPKYPSRPRKQRRLCIVLVSRRCYCSSKRMVMVPSRVMCRCVLEVEEKIQCKNATGKIGSELHSSSRL